LAHDFSVFLRPRRGSGPVSAYGTTRPRRPLASRSAYWGSAAFLGVLHVSAVQSPDFEIEHACEGDQGDKRPIAAFLGVLHVSAVQSPDFEIDHACGGDPGDKRHKPPHRDEELSDRKCHPFWAKAEQLGVLIFIHPQGTAELSTSGRLKGNGVLDNVIGNPLETTIALSHLIFERTLDAYPGLKICAAHAGGYLPSYAARSDQGCVTSPERCTKTLDKKPTEYLRQLYYDPMVFTPEGLRRLVAEVGASQIVLGRDSVSLDQDGGRPHPHGPRAERRRARGNPRRDCGEAPGDQAGVDCKHILPFDRAGCSGSCT
jgi:hypothetical protein